MRSASVMLAALAMIAAPAGATAQPAAHPDGLWINPAGSVAVRTRACGDRLCGWVAWANPSAQRDAQAAGIARLVGTELLENYRPDGPGRWSGTVFVPDMGRRFASQIESPSPGTLRVKGCILAGLICKSQLWTRIARLPQ